MSIFSQRTAARQYCQSWRELTAAEVSAFHAVKLRATCHLNKGHVGDHEDKVLELAWSTGGWPNQHLYSSRLRANAQTPVSKKDMAKINEILAQSEGEQ